MYTLTLWALQAALSTHADTAPHHNAALPAWHCRAVPHALGDGSRARTCRITRMSGHCLIFVSTSPSSAWLAEVNAFDAVHLPLRRRAISILYRDGSMRTAAQASGSALLEMGTPADEEALARELILTHCPDGTLETPHQEALDRVRGN